jgi:hypothetical protein
VRRVMLRVPFAGANQRERGDRPNPHAPG